MMMCPSPPGFNCGSTNRLTLLARLNLFMWGMAHDLMWDSPDLTHNPTRNWCLSRRHLTANNFAAIGLELALAPIPHVSGSDLPRSSFQARRDRTHDDFPRSNLKHHRLRLERASVGYVCDVIFPLLDIPRRPVQESSPDKPSIALGYQVT